MAMLNFNTLIKFFDRGFILKLLLIVLLYSTLPLAEIFILLYLGEIIGDYLTLALAALTGLVGVFIAFGEAKNVLTVLKGKIKEGYYPGKEFISLAGIFTGALFLLTPGFITDISGFLLFFPFFRNLVGRIFTHKMEKRLRELYEYLKLYDI
ncbi:MAG: hypothetical protein DRP87_02650 [Spirochaetes bacterium]|nr:MAG: hypothetical protein DRP87_02650 [Spirochaetota bacterium]